MGITGTERTICCPHRAGRAVWIRNDGMGPPVVLWEAYGDGPVILTLTNQTIKAQCAECFERVRDLLIPLTNQ